MAAVKGAVDSITSFVFPTPAIPPEVRRMDTIETEYMSNLPLQMALYFNVFYFPFWIITSIIMLSAKYDRLHTVYQVVCVSILIIMTVIEITRLYIGYVGNLQEQVPELAGFWILTVIIQVTLALFLLLNPELIVTPLERAIHIVEVTFIIFEIIIGYVAIKDMIKNQVIKFHLNQYVTEDNMNTDYQDTKDLLSPKLA